ncbi:MAG: bifunctional oligoribonuclease/PAP phosphatase NrnA, partial [Muribaculaceae bacterium]|nr:bifunctional oligoribonuclease/PAP phosphatase NrnA [Muribaculaceae bacterium]
MRKILDPSEIKRLKKLIKESKKIVCTCHVHPDGDAIGSTLGLWHLLRKLDKEVAVVVPDQLPKSLRFLPGAGEIAVYTRHDPYCTRLVDEADLILCCDFNTASRQDHLAPLIQSSTAAKVLIDHHENPDMPCDPLFSFPKMSSTCELVFRIIAALGLYEEIDKDCATCILCGMITDTQNFTVNCPDPEIYEVMMKLMEKGADKTKIIDECVKACSYDSLRLKSFALSERMEVFPQHRGIITYLSKEDLSRFHYEKGDTEGLVNMPLNIRGIVYSIFIREDADQIKISARSRYDFPVSKICSELFGGGGHIQAAGGEFKGSLEECLKILKESLGKYDRYLPSRLEK